MTIIGFDMRTTDAGSPGDRNSRAQSTILGLVLLIGIVAMASVGILLHASQSTADVQQETENERIESAFVELSQTMGTTSATGDTTELVDFAAGEHGAVVKKDAGYIHIEGGDVDENLSIGAIEYVGDDGTRIAYQAGGVFRETGNQTQIVSAPPVHYHAATETFTFPVSTVSGETTLDSGEISVRHVQTNPHRDANVIRDDSVRITIESPYYRGWQEYFERQAGDVSVRNVTHPEREGEAGTVEVMIGYLEIDEAFQEGMIVGSEDGYQGQGNPNVTEDDWDVAPMPELDDLIEMMVSDAQEDTFQDGIDEHYDTFTGGTLEAGAYYADEVDLEDDLVADLEDGNVTLIVDGNVTAHGGSITADTDGTDNEFSIWTLGHVSVDSGDVCVDECPEDEPDPEELNASQLQVYGSSESHVSIGPGSSTFEGAVYVASDEDITENHAHRTGGGQCSSQVCILSDIGYYGAIVASSIHVQGGGGSIDFMYDPKLADIDIHPKGYGLPPQLTYLNIAHHELDVRPN